MNDSTCTVAGCDRRSQSRGMCSKHYRRWRHKGSTDSTRDLDPEGKFWAKVRKTDGCWEWTAAKSRPGYGVLTLGPRGNRKNWPAHRFSYVLAFGEVPDGMVVDHRCHNPGCVRPDHLRVISQKQNCEHLRGAKKNNKSSGIRNVHGTGSKKSPWRVTIKHNRVAHYFGCYATLEEAEAVAIRERARLFTHDDAHTWEG